MLRAIYKSLNEGSHGPVILSAAQNLCRMGREILRCAQNDRANLTTCKSPCSHAAGGFQLSDLTLRSRIPASVSLLVVTFMPGRAIVSSFSFSLFPENQEWYRNVFLPTGVIPEKEEKR
jgi:hypothetical protein